MRDKQINKACDRAIAELANGNTKALSKIYDCMARMIFSVAYAITGNYQDAENVLQDTMIEIMKYAHAYQSGSNAKAWILAIARHCSIDIVRKRKQSVSIDNLKTTDLPETRPDLSRLEVLDMLSVLGSEEKQCLILRLYAKMPHKEIAKIMNISVASAQKKYQRAVRKLKDYYL
ncbi:MAG TPA: RNA polymerase sigma factor [Clostridiales bacterium]|nr:RNA polymerase sigma factor [Clostridiales bacterium]